MQLENVIISSSDNEEFIVDALEVVKIKFGKFKI